MRTSRGAQGRRRIDTGGWRGPKAPARRPGWLPTLAALVLVMPAVARPAAAQPAAGGTTRTLAIGPGYAAGGFHRWLFGRDYRALWTAPIEVEELDLHAFAGGLTPVRQVGGRQTKGLALQGQDGRDYTFRAIDKDPSSLLPEDLRDTWVREIVQDQMAAQHPAAPFVVEELAAAAGILHTPQRLVVMPDDPALGEFRHDFAGVVGQLYEFPQARSDRNPGFQGATEILRHEAFYERLQAGDARADARAFLKARLFDLMLGDWDRHRDQWRWVKFPEREAWQPLPDDRDQAFSRYEGLVPGIVRPSVPILQNYDTRYPALRGLAWNGWEQDRQLLAGVELPVYEAVAAELHAAVTGEVIARAARRMPAAHFALDGARLMRDLQGRRDALPAAARAYYRYLADKVKLYLSDRPEYVEVKRLEGGDVQVRVWHAGADGQPSGDAWYQRTLHRRETRELQVYLGGGDDRVVSLGRPDGIELRVIAGAGHDVVDDTRGGGTRLYATHGGELLPGPGSKLDRKVYTPPPPPRNAPWIPPRDWGRDRLWTPWLSYGTDLGVLAGLGVDTRRYGFRQDPFASRQVIRAGWAFGEHTFRADYLANFRFENSPWRADWYAYASGIESARFFGFGNATGDDGRPDSDFFKAKQQQYSFTPALGVALGRNLSLDLGPTLKYTSSTHADDDTLVNRERPYGFGDFGAVGAAGLLEWDTRVAVSRSPGGVAVRHLGYPRGGALIQVAGRVWPKAWDVRETFASIEGSASTYLTPGGRQAPTLALRVGGKKVFGRAPFHEAAYLGGGNAGVGQVAADAMVRGLPRHRYAGDAAVFGNADLRVYVSRFNLILPGEWGLLAFGDAGRVYLEGESSDKWHYGYGGGLWIAWLDRANVLSLSYARAEGRNAVYFRAGFAF